MMRMVVISFTCWYLLSFLSISPDIFPPIYIYVSIWSICGQSMRIVIEIMLIKISKVISPTGWWWWFHLQCISHFDQFLPICFNLINLWLTAHQLYVCDQYVMRVCTDGRHKTDKNYDKIYDNDDEAGGVGCLGWLWHQNIGGDFLQIGRKA